MTANDAELRAERDRLERLFQATPVPLFVLDEARHIVGANRRARHTVGRSAGALDGTPFVELVDPSWRTRTLELLRQAGEGRGPCTTDTGLLTSDGKTLFARMEAQHLPEPDAGVTLVALLVLTEDTANLHLVGDTFDTTRDRVRAVSERYDRG